MKKQSQNKANFKRAKMDVNIYYTEVYENILCIRSQGKQTQSKPISNATQDGGLAMTVPQLTSDSIIQ